MRIHDIAVAGYRSLRQIRFPVGALSVFVGENGVGKTNLYRALQLLQAAARGTLARELAAEGGMQSALWAGKRRADQPVRIRLEASLAMPDNAGPAYSYAVEIGLPPREATAAFELEPQIKEEGLVFHQARRKQMLLERKGPRAVATDADGARRPIDEELLATETALGTLQDAARFPDIDLVRRAMLSWRFYHDFRTDREAPLRAPCLAVTTPTLSSDGADLAAVFATLRHIREDITDLAQAVEDAFPGAALVLPKPERTASFGLRLPDFPKRVFEAGELSDGTLRYLALAGALNGYRLPPFIALNEPETSLHPELLPPLARMIVRAAERTQVWVVTHSERLAAALAEAGDVTPRSVIKREGETWIEGLKLFGAFAEEDGEA